ncbi:hypothetical protein D3OALGA1CA_70 [Olavius algarvensis associated proteobacterium Delta 3]|nr:hypothetical protein D3OALGA1CA_70 [Olavius algarvensis associated proteobacterium Delta 3]
MAPSVCRLFFIQNRQHIGRSFLKEDYKNKILNILKKIKMDIANRQIELIVGCPIFR